MIVRARRAAPSLAIGFALAVLPLLAVAQEWSPTKPVRIIVPVVGGTNDLVARLVAPRLQGVTLNVDPIVVLLSLAFWGAIWGLTGMFLSTPLTVVAIVVLVQFPGTKWISILLSGDGNPEAYSDGPADPSRPAPPKPPPRRRAPRNTSVKS